MCLKKKIALLWLVNYYWTVFLRGWARQDLETPRGVWLLMNFLLRYIWDEGGNKAVQKRLWCVWMNVSLRVWMRKNLPNFFILDFSKRVQERFELFLSNENYRGNSILLVFEEISSWTTNYILKPKNSFGSSGRVRAKITTRTLFRQ